ncbi:MAG: TlpA disulfide reductase family protein [Cellvibrionaceae bacterium]
MKKFLVVCLIGLGWSLGASANDVSGKAPDFTLASNQGKNMRLAEQRGDVVMINFWASWCGPCRQEMPILEELYSRYSRAGFTILGVNVEPNPADADKILNDIKVSFPVLYDTESKVSKLYNVEAMPSTILIDRDGNMRYLHLGYKPGYEDAYRKQIRELIRE